MVGGDGEFVFKDVLPGSYRLAFYCSAGYVTSAVWGETDLLANPTFSIQPGAALAPIEVGARFSGSSLSGEMKLAESSTGKPPGVLLVPQFANATGPVTEQAFQYGQGDSRPYRFSFRGLAPGDYLVFAFASLEEIEFRNPEFLRGLNGGTSVHIEESGQSNITITSLMR